jgi:hypothetical protein
MRPFSILVSLLHRSVWTFFVAVGVLSPVAFSQCPLQSIQSRCDDLPGNIRKWTIVKPDVSKRLTEYPQITFDRGDSVLVSASGCVNVGTNKPDWRRYVDPSGNNTDRFFHGLIWIPGARIPHDPQPLVTPVGTGPVPIASVAGSSDNPSKAEWLIVDAPPEGTKSTLRLGYEADYRHPLLPGDGPYTASLPNSGQCKGSDYASVTIVIKPGPPPADLSRRLTRTLRPFDPVSASTDENGLMFSPRWYGNSGEREDGLTVETECNNFLYKNWLFVRRGIESSCTQQASFDVPSKIITECLVAPGFGELHGHVNWTPATFVGKLRFQDQSADQDFDFQLLTLTDLDRTLRFPGNKDFGKVVPILTEDSQATDEYRNALWLEFASYETTKFFSGSDSSDSFWNKFQDPTKKFLALKGYWDRTAIVTGLLNLDCVHDCHTELHPVYAMALRTKSEDKDNSIRNDDPWAIFVRTAGNEGDCSADEHYLNRDTYTVFLPAPPGSSNEIPSVTNVGDAFHSNAKGVRWTLYRPPNASSNERGVWLRFSFVPEACAAVHSGQMVHVSGLLRLDWSSSTTNELVQSCDGKTSSSQASDFDGSQREVYQVCRNDSPEQPLTCDSATDDDQKQELTLAGYHEKNHPNLSWANTKSTLEGFIGGELGLFPEVILYNKTSQIQVNPGIRYAPFQTALFSFELDGSPGLSRSVKSTGGQSLSVRLGDFLYGFKVQFSHQFNMFAEAKGVEIFRSASAAFASTSDFENFRGRDAGFFVGGGIQPSTSAITTRGNRISIRVSAGYMYFPGTGEHMVRITVGPQFQFHKRQE